MTLRILAWRPTFGADFPPTAEPVARIDQTREVGPAAPERTDDLLGTEVPESTTERVLSLFELPLRAADLVADVFLYAVSGVFAVLATPVMTVLRWLRLVDWRIDVRVGGRLVDKQYVRGLPAARARMDHIEDLLRRNRFRTTGP